MKSIEQAINYTFKNPAYLDHAMTHSSYANEHRDSGIENYERLEFLGDAILNYLSAEALYNRYPHKGEGDLTRLRAQLVCEGALRDVAARLDLGEHIRFGKGEMSGGGNTRPSILADAVESLIAALYLDGGLNVARVFIHTFILARLDGDGRMSFNDYKTHLQEIVQASKQETLSYELTGATGPDHARVYEATLYLNANPFSKGEGRSKKDAEQQAAKAALALMGMLQE